ncbi:MAG: hypothetical protein A2270_00275 [Elusimicrobia bacterium RIFOXYA12_FULL_51_18]|nr:MAG: hypothetical protein A2270_00275 [Elusimicrobia bacterium RIFOXYA12_FULL_51_18]OGS31531.1 MAG: hypothetical protein A2218_09745 [Elusimicrobia bacterium RIFOXYA2_FULL_53_38]
MFIIKKILTPFLLPPGIFAVLAFCLAALQFRRNRKQAPAWAGFALLLWAAATAPVGNMALSGLEYAFLPPAEVKADAIVVLSAGIREGVPEPSGEPALSGISLERAVEAVRLYRRYKLPLIITGGTVFSKGPEAPVIKKYIVSLGVPERDVLAEERARDTWENAVFSKKICDEKGYKKPLIVTSAYHMRRAIWSFKRAGLVGAIPYPTAYKSSKSRRCGWGSFLPGGYEPLSLALHEYLGFIFYRITYA